MKSTNLTFAQLATELALRMLHSAFRGLILFTVVSGRPVPAVYRTIVTKAAAVATSMEQS